MSSILDVRLVLGREGRWLVAVEGRRVLGVDGDRPSTTLAELGRALDGAASNTRRAQAVEASDPKSALFAATPAAAIVEALRGRPAPAANDDCDERNPAA